MPSIPLIFKELREKIISVIQDSEGYVEVLEQCTRLFNETEAENLADMPQAMAGEPSLVALALRLERMHLRAAKASHEWRKAIIIAGAKRAK